MKKGMFFPNFIPLMLALFQIPALASEGTAVINFSVALDESATVDRLVYSAIRRLPGFDMTVETAPMAYAVQMANSGEKDALVAQAVDLEKTYRNLVQVPESIFEVRFEAYVKTGFSKPIDGWRSLSGLRVGTLMHKNYLEAHLPDGIAAHIYRNSNSELVAALLADECDVIVVTTARNAIARTPPGVSLARIVDSIHTYVYLNKKHEGIAFDLADAIRAMKADGTHERIANAAAGDARRPKKVLHISSYYGDDPWESRLVEQAAKVFSSRDDIRYTNVALNANRALDENNRSRSVFPTLRTLYLSGAPDVVIASDNEAAEFVMDYHSVLFSDVPVIFCGQNGDVADQLWKVGGLCTGVYETIPAEETIRLALKLFPNTQTVFVMNGFSETGREWRREIREQLESMPEREKLNIAYSKGASLTNVLDEVAALPPDSVVLCGVYSLDSAGQYYSQKELQSELRKRCDLPIFGMRYGSIGYGQIGGKYVDSGMHGETAAKIALRVLDGEDIASFPILKDTRSFNRWIFDHRVFAEIGFRDNQLPAGSTIINKPPSFYQTNPVALFLTILFSALAFFAIAGLLAFSAVISKKNRRLIAVQQSLHTAEELIAKDAEIVAIARRLEVALAASGAGAWEIDFGGGIFIYDSTIARTLGLEPGGKVPLSRLREALAVSLEGFAGSEREAALVRGDAEAFVRLTPGELTYTLKDGQKCHCRSYIKMVYGEDGRVERIIGLLVDVTQNARIRRELTAAKEAAEYANKAKSQFLSNMSHEIRTPMNAIIGMADLLANESLSEKQTCLVRDIRISATSLLAIINDLLDLSRIESDKFDLEPVNYNLKELLENLNSMFLYSANAKNISFRFSFDANLPEYAFGDDVRVRQVLINVLGNAVKYTRQGSVTFLAGLDGDTLSFTVLDTGIGIRQEDLQSIFVEYARFDPHKNRAAISTGLGLAITKKLVDKMAGAIVVQSEYGAGTRVRITLPYVPGSPVEDVAGHGERQLLSAPEAKILVVDDNPVNLRVAAGILNLFDIVCDTAASGREAIDKVRSGAYDLVLMDQMMPDMDGVETVRILRSEGYATGGLPIVALTANAISGAREHLLDAGMDDFLSKPIDKAQLCRILAKWLPPGKVRLAQAADRTSAADESWSPFLKEAGAIDGLDVAEGLLLLDGNQDGYRELLGTFMHTIPQLAGALQNALAAGRMDLLSIEAHGLKGGLRYVGALALAEKALGIEQNARAENAGFCREHLPALLDGIQALAARLGRLFAAFPAQGERKTGDPQILHQRLADLRRCLDGFDIAAAREVLSQLSAYEFDPRLNELLARAGQLAEAFDFAAAASVIDAMDAVIAGNNAG